MQLHCHVNLPLRLDPGGGAVREPGAHAAEMKRLVPDGARRTHSKPSSSHNHPTSIRICSESARRTELVSTVSRVSDRTTAIGLALDAAAQEWPRRSPRRYAAAAGAGPESTRRFPTGSTMRFSPSSVRDPRIARSSGSPNTTSSGVTVPAA